MAARRRATRRLQQPRRAQQQVRRRVPQVPEQAAPAFALTDTLPLTPTAGITGTAPITATAPATATVPGPRVAQPVQAQKILTTVHAMEVISTTGQKTVPDHAAIGTIRLAN